VTRARQGKSVRGGGRFEVVTQRVLKCSVSVTADHQACRFVEDSDVLIFVDHVDGTLEDLVVGGWGLGKTNHVAGLDKSGGFHHFSIEEKFAALQGFSRLVSRGNKAEVVASKAIDSYTFGVVRNDEFDGHGAAVD